MKVTVLAGGVGAARFLEGVLAVVAAEDVTVISNVGDDEEFFGLHVSPDIDTVIYTLSGAIDTEKGWGLRGETFRALEALRVFGRDAWFNLGDGDLATHVHRTQVLREGGTLSSATASIGAAYGLRFRILPVTDGRLRTRLSTDAGELSFQQYFVQQRTEPAVRGVRFEGAGAARPAPGVLDAIDGADAVLVAPSNPVVSLGPILAVPGVREALRERRDRVAAVSPIVGGKTIKGPADRMMATLGMSPTAGGVAAAYADFARTLVIDEVDADAAAAIAAAGVRPIIARTIMRDLDAKRELARAALGAALD